MTANFAKAIINASVTVRSSTRNIMLVVCVALFPGLLTSAYFFGFGIVINVLISILTVLLLEALILQIRDLGWHRILDGSAVLTGLLLGLALPPDLPPWMTIIGAGFAIIFGKHLYGGLGQNPFNPAMVGYAVLILSFPLAMSSWPMPLHVGMDGMSAATPLDALKFRGAVTIDEVWQVSNGFGFWAGLGWQWINLAYLGGGLVLIFSRTIRWQAPLAMLLTLSILSGLFFDNGSSQSFGSPLFHLFSGGTMLVAFFILTDPVTAPGSNTGLIIFGAGVGLLTFILRTIGAYPDGFAFAILLMNALVPLIDHIRFRRAPQ